MIQKFREGIHLQLANGYIVSIQMGFYHYCIPGETAEIAAFHSETRDWAHPDDWDDDVKGDCDGQAVAEFIAWASALPAVVSLEDQSHG